MKYVYFDMDNTLCDLKGVENVWERLDNYDVTPYIECMPINKNIELLKKYKSMGYVVVILSCLSRVTNKEFDRQTIEAKSKWLDMYVGKQYIDMRMYIPYTKHKEDYVWNRGTLVDDDIVILSNWNKGKTIAA